MGGGSTQGQPAPGAPAAPEARESPGAHGGTNRTHELHKCGRARRRSLISSLFLTYRSRTQAAPRSGRLSRSIMGWLRPRFPGERHPAGAKPRRAAADAQLASPSEPKPADIKAAAPPPHLPSKVARELFDGSNLRCIASDHKAVRSDNVCGGHMTHHAGHRLLLTSSFGEK